MRASILALLAFLPVALLLSLPARALADEPHATHASIEGPRPGSALYTVRVLSCDERTTLEPWALAEGVVDGERRSVLLRVRPTRQHCVFHIARAWPTEGRWMIRLSLGHPPAPATVTTLGADGSVERNQLFEQSDGSRECSEALRPYSSEPKDC